MLQLGIKRGRSIAIDLGNNNTILTDKDQVCLSQPSVIVINKDNKTVKAVGVEAYDMQGKAHSNLKVVKPLRGGVIADFDSATKMLKALMGKAYPQKSYFFGFDNIISGVPYSTTEVERRALRDALSQFSSHKTYLLFEPLAAAIGLGLNIQEPDGKLLVDIGGGITEAVLISLSGVVSYKSIKVAGDSFNEDIKNYIKRNYSLEIGTSMAELAKINVGAATETLSIIPEPFKITGKDMMTGIPKSFMIDHVEMAYILNNSIVKIEQAIMQILEECPPELAGDIYVNGLHLTGGGSLLRGLKERLEAKVRIKVHLDPKGLLTVTNGISTVLRNPEKFKTLLFT